MVFLKQAFIWSLESYFPVSKHQIELENTGRYTPSAIICIGQPYVQQSPPLMTGHFEKRYRLQFWSKDHKCGPIFMFDVILDSGEQMSVFRSISLHSKTIFHINFQNLALSGGDTKIKKITPLCRKFLFKIDGWYFYHM